MNCPCCPGGEILATGICDTCGVGIARGTTPPTRTRQPWRTRPDQDRVGAMTDYARTKEDK
jgi:hypothetical protein